MKINSNFKKILTLGFFSLLLIININNSNAQSYGDYNTDNTNACINLNFNLKFRSKDINTNGQVSDLQSFLQDKGYLNSEPTGFFGRLTENAVKSYQSSVGLASTGFVGQYTREKIRNETCRNVSPGPIMCTKEIRYCTNGQAMERDSNTCRWKEELCDRGPISCTMEMRYCSNGQPMQRDSSTCRWKEELCGGQTNLEDYFIGLSIYSSNLNKYLTKNNSGYFDATDVDGNTNFQISINNNFLAGTYGQTPINSNQSNNIMCNTQSRTNSGYYSNISSSMNFSQSYNKNGLGLDYYKISCGDGLRSKIVEQEFIVETKSPSVDRGPISCTMEMRYCTNGQAMERDSSCRWKEELCDLGPISRPQ